MLQMNEDDMPDFVFETELGCRVAGVDEVGRGPLAGPVTAAAVVLDPSCIPEGLDDSKKLSAKKRLILYQQLLMCADVSIAHASVAEIDEIKWEDTQVVVDMPPAERAIYLEMEVSGLCLEDLIIHFLIHC